MGRGREGEKKNASVTDKERETVREGENQKAWEAEGGREGEKMNKNETESKRERKIKIER